MPGATLLVATAARCSVRDIGAVWDLCVPVERCCIREDGLRAFLTRVAARTVVMFVRMPTNDESAWKGPNPSLIAARGGLIRAGSN